MARFKHEITKKPPPAKPRVAHDFRDANKIPYIKRPAEIFLYPHAESHIPQEHNERYPHLVDILKSVVEQTPKLAADRNWLAGTCYSMYMCGSDKDTAVPSIVVFCSEIDLSLVKCLQRTLAEQHVAAQYNSPTGPRFKIYIWAETFALCGGSGDVVEIHLDGRTTTCGAQVTDIGSSINLCTVAAVLEIKSCFYALTSAHGIVSLPARTQLDQRNHTPTGFLATPSVDSPPLCETEYDFGGLLDLPLPGPQDSPSKEKYLLDPIRCQVLRTPNDEEWHKQESNLDFSLLQLGNPEAWTLNTYRVWSADSGSNQNIRVEKTPAVRPSSARQVRIIGSNDDTVVGTIRSTPSFILNSTNTKHLCEVWTVSPQDKNSKCTLVKTATLCRIT